MAEAFFPVLPGTLETEAPSTDGVPVGSGMTNADGSVADAKFDHCVESQSHLLSQFQKPRWEAMACAFADQLQELENVFRDLFIYRTIENATGEQLIRLGSIVGEKPGNRTEAAFRKMIQIRILRNRAKGRASDIYKILDIGLDAPVSVRIVEEFPAAFRVLVFSGLGTLSLDDIGEALRAAKAVGVRIDVVDESVTDLFLWRPEPPGTGPADADPIHGWGTEADLTVGGKWASVV